MVVVVVVLDVARVLFGLPRRNRGQENESQGRHEAAHEKMEEKMDRDP